MRGRFVTLGGKPVEQVKPSDKVAWALEGDRGVTFADKPPEGSEVVAGTWWPSDYSGPPLVSMEKEVAEGLGLRVGDTVVVNVLGRDIAAKLTELAQSELEELRHQFRAGLFAECAQRRALHRTRLRGPPLRRAGRRTQAHARRGAAIPGRRQRAGARSHGQCRNAGRQARAGDPRGDRGRADDLGPGARRRACGQSARAPRRRDNSEDPRARPGAV